MKLVDVEIPLDKLYEYCLNPEHPRGSDKAFLFEQALGINLKNADVLYSLLLKAVEETEAQLVRSDKYGEYFRIDYELDSVNGKETLRSTWMVAKGSQRARLISCFIRRRKK
jgi:hypothetical protein